MESSRARAPGELAQHVAEHYAELVAAGTPEREAVERALAPIDRGPPRRCLPPLAAR